MTSMCVCVLTRILVVFFLLPDKSQGPEKNLVLFDVASGEPIFEMYQKSFSSEAWPTLHFDAQEKYVTKMVTNEIHFYELAKHKTEKLAAPDFKLR